MAGQIDWPDLYFPPVNLWSVWAYNGDWRSIRMEQQQKTHGPQLPISEETHARKHRLTGETFREAMSRIAGALSDDPGHFYTYRDILLDQRFLPAGRVQSATGSPRKTTAFNCYVSGTIEDSMDGIMRAAAEAASTMRLGGGIGYDFSTIRPRGDTIVSLDSKSSGPISFMHIFDSVCRTIASAGQRRGAQMGVMRVDHPDIEEFIEAKTNSTNLTQFNLSVAVTDEFMHAVENNASFDLKWNGRTYKRVDAHLLWEKLMRATWDWAEPGILFIDRINEMNNLWYCETIAATNPCGEQPLPPYGACLLGSFNLVKYVKLEGGMRVFDWDQFYEDIPHVVRAQDNIIDRTIYPLPQQEAEAKNKRRMGLGYTGLANAGEALGFDYGSDQFLDFQENVSISLVVECYRASIALAKEKGPFPALDKDKYLSGKFVAALPESVRDGIAQYGIRNSHLISIAPTGTISLTADNVSSGCEPVFSYFYDRTIIDDDGDKKIERVSDYGYRVFGVEGKTADECTVDEHLNVLIMASRFVDSAVSKTLNVGSDVSWEDFKNIYMRAWRENCKGCTTFRADGKRYGVLNKVDAPSDSTACYIDTETGKKTCE